MKLSGKISKKSVKIFAAAVCAGVILSWGGQGYATGADDGTFKNFSEEMQRELYGENYDETIERSAVWWRQNNQFRNGTGLGAINADKAYALGYSGAGVTLGIVDSGVHPLEHEFEGKVDNVNMTPEQVQERDWNDNTHGTMVASIMAAGRNGMVFSPDDMQGAAYGVKRIESFNKKIDKEKNYFTKFTNARVINNSYNHLNEYAAKSFTSDVNESMTSDRVYVFASGNQGALNTSYTVTALNKNDKKNNLINVVSTDIDDCISALSNLANGAEKITVSALGCQVSVVDPSNTNGYSKKMAHRCLHRM